MKREPFPLGRRISVLHHFKVTVNDQDSSVIQVGKLIDLRIDHFRRSFLKIIVIQQMIRIMQQGVDKNKDGQTEESVIRGVMLTSVSTDSIAATMEILNIFHKFFIQLYRDFSLIPQGIRQHFHRSDRRLKLMG